MKTIMSNKGSRSYGNRDLIRGKPCGGSGEKAISSPLRKTSIDGAQGVLMNITGGTNLSLFEVRKAADIVATASDQDVNMIFSSVINENLKDEIVVTVIATGFNEVEASIRPTGRPTLGQRQQSRPRTQQQTPQQ